MKLWDNVSRSLFVVTILVSLVAQSCTALEPTPPELVRPAQVLRPALEFRPVKGAEGAMREATLFVGTLPLISRRLEIRTISVAPHEKAVLPTEHEIALELRSGSLETVIDGVRQRRRSGEIWLVAQGARVTLNVLGEHAVLRAIYLIRESR